MLCGVKIVQRSLTKNSATNSLGYTTLTSYPALSLSLFLSKIFTFYIPKRVYAHIREVKKSERESLERLKERECVCIYYSSFSERKEVKSNTIYNSREE